MDNDGNYLRIAEENGYQYEFTWNEELEIWVRRLGKMFAWDNSRNSALPVRWFMAEGVPGGNIKEIIYQDYVDSDDPNTLSQSINPIIRDRLGLANSEMKFDMFDKGITFSYTINDVSNQVVFDKDTGIKVFIVTPESLEPFVGEGGVSLVTYYSDTHIAPKFFSRLISVDKEGELVFVVASPKPLDQLTEEHLRHMLVLNFTNFILEEDQTQQEFSTPVDRHERLSGEPRANGKPTIEIIWNK